MNLLIPHLEEAERFGQIDQTIQPRLRGRGDGCIDCRTPLSAAGVAAIHARHGPYAVLVFRDQKLSDKEQLRFTLYFGHVSSAAGRQWLAAGDAAFDAYMLLVEGADEAG
jgi:hypothetical protein